MSPIHFYPFRISTPWKSTHTHQKLAHRISYTIHIQKIVPNLSEYAMCVRYWFYGTQHSQFFYELDSERLVYENGACLFSSIILIWNSVWNSNNSEVTKQFRISKWMEIWGDLCTLCKTVQILENPIICRLLIELIHLKIIPCRILIQSSKWKV